MNESHFNINHRVEHEALRALTQISNIQEDKEWTFQKKAKHNYIRKKIKIAALHDEKISKLPLLMNKNNINEHYQLSLFC